MNTPKGYPFLLYITAGGSIIPISELNPSLRVICAYLCANGLVVASAVLRDIAGAVVANIGGFAGVCRQQSGHGAVALLDNGRILGELHHL